MIKGELILLDLERNVPDYTCDGYHANALARRIENFWHDKGYREVKVWVVKDKKTEDGPFFHYIRSNIKYHVKGA